MKTANHYINETSMIHDARLLLDRAQREGSDFLFVPRWMLEQLIERATRPHD